MLEDLHLSTALEKAEAAHIKLVLGMTNWHRGEAASLLGVCYRTLLYKIKKYGWGKTQRKREPKTVIKPVDPAHS